MTCGYCKRCDRLVPIVAKAPPIKVADGQPPPREPNWYPVPHDDGEGKPCLDGHEVAL